MKPIILNIIGPCGVGKTPFARRLAAHVSSYSERSVLFVPQADWTVPFEDEFGNPKTGASSSYVQQLRRLYSLLDSGIGLETPFRFRAKDPPLVIMEGVGYDWNFFQWPTNIVDETDLRLILSSRLIITVEIEINTPDVKQHFEALQKIRGPKWRDFYLQLNEAVGDMEKHVRQCSEKYALLVNRSYIEKLNSKVIAELEIDHFWNKLRSKYFFPK